MIEQEGPQPTQHTSREVGEKLALAQQKLERLLDNQLQSINTLQNTMGVVLGLTIAGLGFIITSGHELFLSNRYLAIGGIGLIVGSAIILSFTFFFNYYDAPTPISLVGGIVSSKTSLASMHQTAVAGLAEAYHGNRLITRLAQRYLSLAVIMLILGLTILVTDLAL